jgi:hypothetical protein
MVPVLHAVIARPEVPLASTADDADEVTAAVAWLARQLAWGDRLEHLGRHHLEAAAGERASGLDSWRCGRPCSATSGLHG